MNRNLAVTLVVALCLAVLSCDAVSILHHNVHHQRRASALLEARASQVNQSADGSFTVPTTPPSSSPAPSAAPSSASGASGSAPPVQPAAGTDTPSYGGAVEHTIVYGVGMLTEDEIEKRIQYLDDMLGKSKAIVAYQEDLRKMQHDFENNLIDKFGGDLRNQLWSDYNKIHLSYKESGSVKNSIEDSNNALMKQLVSDQFKLRKALKEFYTQVTTAHSRIVSGHERLAERQTRLRAFATRVSVQANQLRLAFDTLHDKVVQNLDTLHNELVALRNGTNETTSWLNDKTNTMFRVLSERLQNASNLAKESYNILAERSTNQDELIDRLKNYTRHLYQKSKNQANQITALFQRLSSAESKSTTQDNRIQMLSEKVDVLTKSAEQLRQTLSDLRTRYDRMVAEKEVQDKRISDINTWLTSVHKDTVSQFQVLQDKIKTLAQGHNTLTGQGDVHQKAINKLGKRLANLRKLAHATANLVNYARSQKVFA